MNKEALYFIWGEEDYLIDQQIREITVRVNGRAGDEVEIVQLDGEEMTPYELGEQLEFSPLFALYRVVVIKRPHWLGKGTKKRGGKGEAFVQVMNDYLDSLPAGQTLILCCDSCEKTNPLVKRLSQEAVIIHCGKMDNRKLEDWIKTQIEARACSTSPRAIKMMANSGQDMYYLLNLIEKLSLQVQGQTIQDRDIERELISREDIKVFKLTDALFKRDLKTSIQAFHQLLEQGEPPLVFLSVALRQFAHMAKVKAYHERGYDSRQIAELSGLKDFMVRKFMDAGRKFSEEDLEQCFRAFLETDAAIKSTSKDPQILIETLLVDICRGK